MRHLPANLLSNDASDKRQVQEPGAQDARAADRQLHNRSIGRSRCHGKRAPNWERRTNQTKPKARLPDLRQLEQQRDTQAAEPLPCPKARSNLAEPAVHENETSMSVQLVSLWVRLQLQEPLSALVDGNVDLYRSLYYSRFCIAFHISPSRPSGPVVMLRPGAK